MTSDLTVLMVTTYAGGTMAVEGVSPEVRDLWDDTWRRPVGEAPVASVEPPIVPYDSRQPDEIERARLEVEAALRPRPESLWS